MKLVEKYNDTVNIIRSNIKDIIMDVDRYGRLEYVICKEIDMTLDSIQLLFNHNRSYEELYQLNQEIYTYNMKCQLKCTVSDMIDYTEVKMFLVIKHI